MVVNFNNSSINDWVIILYHKYKKQNIFNTILISKYILLVDHKHLLPKDSSNKDYNFHSFPCELEAEF